MKNDIDSLLESMFRGGRFQFKELTPQKEGKPGEAPAGSPEKALEAVEQAEARMADALQKSIRQLTEETRADLEDLDAHLKQDGVDNKQTAGNSGSPEDLEEAFRAARQEVSQRVLGQEAFLDRLLIAFKRPFVAGSDPEAPLCRGAVLGGVGTGRHTAVEAMAASLGRRGVLKSPKTQRIDLARYTAPGSEKLFVQDLYAALKSGASVLLFEGYESCHASVLSLVSRLFREGRVPLPGRYVEQKGLLVEIGGALAPGAVSELSCGGKYLFFLTSRSEAKLTDAFGAPFLAAMDDICRTEQFSRESLLALADGLLKVLCARLEQKLSFTFTYGEEEQNALADACSPDAGVNAMERAVEDVYRLLSEAKLNEGLGPVSGQLFVKDGRLCARYALEENTVELIPGTAEDPSNALLEAVRAELSEIVGLASVKEYILGLEANVKMQQLRREKGLKSDPPSMHMIFTGNPGTGKTTVARLVSRYLKAIGVLSGGQLIEVTRADLVGQYVGHTAPLTNKAISAALGGVLFIDEAYSLYRGKDDSFGLEAIDALVKGMEDYRDQLIVILAGYSREMEEFLTANSGLRSRFPNIIEFPDYTAEELFAITESIVRGKGYRMDPACKQPLLDYFTRMQQEGDPRTNGNGRMARNEVEEAVIACSRRNMAAPEAERDLELLLPEDFKLE